MLAPEIEDSLIVENVETAARHKRSDISAGKPEVRVHGENGIGKNFRFVIVRINGVDRIDHWIVRRKRRGDDFISADSRAGETAIESVNKTGCVSDVRAAENGGLLHRTANFATARKFRDVIDAAAEFGFRAGATDNHKRK